MFKILWMSAMLSVAGFSVGCATSGAWISKSEDGRRFVRSDTGDRFIAWGFNYDRDYKHRLIEDYWEGEWSTVESDFAEMKALGANVVRIHLQVGRFMSSPDQPNDAALKKLDALVKCAERTGLYLDITGLGCYHKQDVPPWYDAISESDRWAVQARFWSAAAKTCAPSHAIFCYDLMNEPILAGNDKVETDWLAGELGGKYFVQRLTLDLKGRSRKEVVQAWIETLVPAIRKHDTRHLITVGAIPWALTFGPKAKPVIHDPETSKRLDFVAVHFYPKKGDIDGALAALAVYEIGKPVVIEETFPLGSSPEQMEDFIRRAGDRVDGWISFYWGQTPDELDQEKTIGAAITASWLRKFQAIKPVGQP